MTRLKSWIGDLEPSIIYAVIGSGCWETSLLLCFYSLLIDIWLKHVIFSLTHIDCIFSCLCPCTRVLVSHSRHSQPATIDGLVAELASDGFLTLQENLFFPTITFWMLFHKDHDWYSSFKKKHIGDYFCELVPYK